MKALAFVALTAVGCGGRSKLLAHAGDSAVAIIPPGPDASRDALADLSPPDAGPVFPDVSPNDTRTPQPDGPPILPDVVRTPDLVVIPPPGPDSGMEVPASPGDARLDLPPPPPADARLDLPPPPVDARLDVPPPPVDARLDVPPPPVDARLDVLPPPFDARLDVLPPNPDLVLSDVLPINPDGPPPAQLCAEGEACSSDCMTTCQFLGTRACTCTSGTLACGACQPPQVVFTFTPCPDNASGTACDSTGVACPIYTNGNITGVCACLDRGVGARWMCLGG